ncbi:MAG: hypothetical protein ABSF87_05845 [Xanthobacteraceae bacterium]|jgi:hypothetical protein
MGEEVLNLVKDEVEKTIQRLNTKQFTPDPIAGRHFSKITSILSSAYKRHGYILEHALLEALKQCPYFEVWRDELFQVPSTVDHIVEGSIVAATKLIGTDYPYSDGQRTLQVDILVFDKNTGILKAYEVKRGAGLHDSGKRRSMLRDVLCVQVLLKSYGKQRGLDVKEAFSHIIFYYGQCSIPKPFSLIGSELDEHFGWPVQDAVEEVNAYFQSRLFAILSGAG